MRQILLFSFFLISGAFFLPSVQATESVWILVDTKKLSLEVKQGNKVLAVMNNIAIGKNGAGFKKHKGDEVTPLGEYKIAWINNKSHFHKFYGFDYPSVENANEALLRGLLSKASQTAIVNAHNKKRVPSQGTKIGGFIGIHGLGEADKEIHKLMNWTNGCIALTNEQIDRLGRWVGKGTVVKVK